MATTLDAHKQRWTFLKSEKQIGPMVPGQAITDYFLSHVAIGSPIGPETDWFDRESGKIRAFSGGTVGWSPGGGLEVNPQP